jgi:hypothetical protein
MANVDIYVHVEMIKLFIYLFIYYLFVMVMSFYKRFILKILIWHLLILFVHVDKSLLTMIIAIVLVSKPRLSIGVGTSTSRDFALDDDLQEEAKV